jgi:hypothetical protein
MNSQTMFQTMNLIKGVAKKTAGLGLVVLLPTFGAAAGTPQCTARVSEIAKEWRQINFETPVKPGQVYVLGNGNHRELTMDVALMQKRLNKAIAACRNGESERALALVAEVDHQLNHKGETFSASSK